MLKGPTEHGGEESFHGGDEGGEVLRVRVEDDVRHHRVAGEDAHEQDHELRDRLRGETERRRQHPDALVEAQQLEELDRRHEDDDGQQVRVRLQQCATRCCA